MMAVTSHGADGKFARSAEGEFVDGECVDQRSHCVRRPFDLHACRGATARGRLSEHSIKCSTGAAQSDVRRRHFPSRDLGSRRLEQESVWYTIRDELCAERDAAFVARTQDAKDPLELL